MPRTIETTVYQFSELSDKAKETARDWYRSAAFDHEWWDFVYEDAVRCAAILGIDIAARNQKCIYTGKPQREWIDRSPAIYFSGFSSQGDGACFEGSYTQKPDAASRIRDHAPKDLTLHAIADSLAALPVGEWCATIRHRGHYNHSGCMDVDVSYTEPDDIIVTDGVVTHGEGVLIQAMRDFADWIYDNLQREYEWMNEDSQVDESIVANEYEFTANGESA